MLPVKGDFLSDSRPITESITFLLDGSFPDCGSRKTVVKSHLLGDEELIEMVSGTGA